MKNYLTIYELIENQKRKNSQQMAILNTHAQGLNYGELFSQVNYVIQQLSSWGVSQEDKIAIALPNGVEMAVTFLSVTNVAICCPLNPNYRTPEWEFYLSDLQPKFLLTQEGVSPEAIQVAQRLNISIIELIPDSENKGNFTLDLKSVSTKTQSFPQSKITPSSAEDIALVLHTSGTTSRPKQVPLTHFNLCISAHNISTTLQLSQSDRCLNVMPLFHIHGLMGVLLSSISAGASIICSRGFNYQYFLPWLKDLQATWYSAVPTIHQQVLSQAQQNPEIVDKTRLRFIRSSSASLPATVMTELERIFKVPVIEAYGMTEASHQMTSNPLPPHQRKHSSVGLPQGLEVAIMDQAGNLLANHHIGEVVIKGKNVTQGYLNNPTANSTAFTDGWFRTGDNGYLDEDGYLFLKGRIKEIINRGGEKILPRFQYHRRCNIFP